MKIKKEIAWAFKLVWAKMATKKIEIKKIFGMGLQINLDLPNIPLLGCAYQHSKAIFFCVVACTWMFHVVPLS